MSLRPEKPRKHLLLFERFAVDSKEKNPGSEQDKGNMVEFQDNRKEARGNFY